MQATLPPSGKLLSISQAASPRSARVAASVTLLDWLLLPLLRNPGGGPRQPLFTNEQLARLRTELASRFHFRPVMVRVYGEWRKNTGELVPDDSLLIQTPRRSRRTIPNLRRFIRLRILGDPSCDQDYIYLSSCWRGEFVALAWPSCAKQIPGCVSATSVIDCDSLDGLSNIPSWKQDAQGIPHANR